MAIESAFGRVDQLVVLTGRLHELDEELTEDERSAVSRAVAKRRREFAAGRALARQGLRALGVEAVSIPMSARRYPVWPEGIVGSISHTSERVGVALAKRRDYAAVGLDLEARSAVTPDLFDAILVDAERPQLATGAPEEAATLVFSCKEAIFKAVNPLFDEFLDFQDVRIELLDRMFRARCSAACKSAAAVHAGRGYFEIDEGVVKSLFVLKR